MALLDKKMWDGYTALALLVLLFFLFVQIKGRFFNDDCPVVTTDSISYSLPTSAWRKPDTLHINYASPWQLTAAGFSAYDINTLLYARDRGAVFHSPDDVRDLFAYRDMSNIEAIIPSVAFDERRRKPRSNYDHVYSSYDRRYSQSTPKPRRRRIPLFLADSLELSQSGMSPEAWDTLSRYQSAFVLSGSMPIDSLVDCSPAELAARLAPHVHSVRRQLFTPSESSPRPDPVELNAATADQLVLIPGIGEKTAASIINLRRDLGGFVSPRQLIGLWPISDESYALMEPFLFADSAAVSPVNVNSTNDTRMRRHPYFPPLLVVRINQLKLQNPKARLSKDDIQYCAEGIDLNPFFWSYVSYDKPRRHKN